MKFDESNMESLLVDKGRVVRAKYSRPELPKFKGHPLILSLPRINTAQKASDAMAKYPKYRRDPRTRPPDIRSHMVMDILHMFQPLPVHLKLKGMVSRVIRDGYLSRNPVNPAYSGNLEKRLKYFEDKRHAPYDLESTAAGFFIAGMSGVGKTTGVRRVLSLYDQIIIHSEFKGRKFTRMQIVWLRLQCPRDGSLTSLCRAFFETIDDILGTSYTNDYADKARNLDELVFFMALVAANHHLGILVIDEIQNLSSAKSGGAEQMLNFFVLLINTIGVPVVLIGTYKAIPVLTSEFRQARRGSGQGDLVWDRMPLGEDWNFYLEALWGLQYVRNVCPLTPEISRALHDVSYGITDLANRIYMAAQWRAIETGVETVSEDMIRSAYRDDFRLVNRILDALKSGNLTDLHGLEDVCPPAILPITTGIEPETSSESNTTATGRDREPSARDELPLLKQNGKQAKDKKKQTREVVFEDGDLRKVVSDGLAADPPVDQYQSLLDAGYIRPATEFLGTEDLA
jgi:hypothetical protein